MPNAMDLCELAWGEQPGYVYLTTRDPQGTPEDDTYWRDLRFEWPADREKIRSTLDAARTAQRDVYWAPVVYARPRRSREAVDEARVLYADLDEVDPHTLLNNLKPTAAWETSPGRYQALWVLEHPIPAAEHERLNQTLTYSIGADKGGWGLSKVLRIPGTTNHKPDYDEPQVKFTWLNGRKMDPGIIQDLPIPSIPVLNGHTTIELPHAGELYERVKKRLPVKARQMLKVKRVEKGIRSEQLWALECMLAEAGLTELEIVALVKASSWNKFRGRADENTRLLTEARKARVHTGVEQVAEEPIGSMTYSPVSIDDAEFEVSEESSEEAIPSPISWKEFDRQHENISWLVADVWGEAEVGFISGLPKSYKSWISLDLGISVATGGMFLGSFSCKRRNVLLIQEEDPKPVLQDRMVKIAAGKGIVGINHIGDNSFEFTYELPENLFIISNQGFTVTGEEWMERIEEFIKANDIGLTIIDPLFMTAEGVDEFKAFDMNAKVLRPLKMLRAHTKSAITVVHHHIKNAGSDGRPGGQAMYGSVALWAWEEAALHLQVSGLGQVTAERFSKHSLLAPLTIAVGDTDKGWIPEAGEGVNLQGLLDILAGMSGGVTMDELTTITKMGKDALNRQLKILMEQGKVGKRKGEVLGKGGGRPKIVFFLVSS